MSATATLVDAYNQRKPKSFSRLRGWTSSRPRCPRWTTPSVVVPAPGAGPGNWAGAALGRARRRRHLADLPRTPPAARRPRRRHGRAPARTTGSHFEPVCEVYRDEFGAESFERPVVLRRPDGGWRLYLSCATPGLQALVDRGPRRRPARGPADTARRTVVLPGDDAGRRQGPGDHRARRPLGDVAVRAPADRARPRGPDDHVVPHQRRRPRLGPATAPCSTPHPRHLGRARRPGDDGALARPARGAVRRTRRPPRTTGTRPPRSPAPTRPACCTPTPTRPVLRSPDSDGALRYATAVPQPGRRRPASTSSWPAPTGRTTW